LQVFGVGGAGADHPFQIHVPEGRYLKVVFGRVLGSALVSTIPEAPEGGGVT